VRSDSNRKGAYGKVLSKSDYNKKIEPKVQAAATELPGLVAAIQADRTNEANYKALATKVRSVSDVLTCCGTPPDSVKDKVYQGAGRAQRGRRRARPRQGRPPRAVTPTPYVQARQTLLKVKANLQALATG